MAYYIIRRANTHYRNAVDVDIVYWWLGDNLCLDRRTRLSKASLLRGGYRIMGRRGERKLNKLYELKHIIMNMGEILISRELLLWDRPEYLLKSLKLLEISIKRYWRDE